MKKEIRWAFNANGHARQYQVIDRQEWQGESYLTLYEPRENHMRHAFEKDTAETIQELVERIVHEAVLFNMNKKSKTQIMPE